MIGTRMTSERWLKIEELYHSALEGGRGVLAGVDPEVKREVERLLAAAPTGQGLLDTPAALTVSLLAHCVNMCQLYMEMP